MLRNLAKSSRWLCKLSVTGLRTERNTFLLNVSRIEACRQQSRIEYSTQPNVGGK